MGLSPHSTPARREGPPDPSVFFPGIRGLGGEGIDAVLGSGVYLVRGEGKEMGYTVRAGLVYVGRVKNQGKIASIEPFAVAPEGTVFRKNNEPAIRLEKGVKWGVDFMRRKR